MRVMTCLICLLAASLVLAGCGAKKPVITEGASVKFNYTLTVDGKVMDSSEGREPLACVQGSHQIVPGLEEQLLGMKVGESKTVTVPPEKGYGQRDTTAVRQVPLTSFANPESLRVDGVVRGESEGRRIAARVTQIGPDTVTLDFNHPLAGKTLVFDITITEIVPPAKPAAG